MNWNPTLPDDGLSRRSFLAAGATGAAITTSGCMNSVRSVVGQAGDDQLSLSIATVPAEGDKQSIQIARRLESNLKKAGMAVSLDVRSQSEMLKAVLIDHDFDIYVGLHPARLPIRTSSTKRSTRRTRTKPAGRTPSGSPIWRSTRYWSDNATPRATSGSETSNRS
jgi:hypothetical protein